MFTTKVDIKMFWQRIKKHVLWWTCKCFRFQVWNLRVFIQTRKLWILLGSAYSCRRVSNAFYTTKSKKITIRKRRWTEIGLNDFQDGRKSKVLQHDTDCECRLNYEISKLWFVSDFTYKKAKFRSERYRTFLDRKRKKNRKKICKKAQNRVPPCANHPSLYTRCTETREDRKSRFQRGKKTIRSA